MDHEQTKKINRGRRGRVGTCAISRSDQPPYKSMDEEPKPFKIVGYENATVPAPSQKLYDALALRAWTDYRTRMEIHVGHEMPEWDELPEHLRAVWLGVAHGQHGVVALFGGCGIQYIDAE